MGLTSARPVVIRELEPFPLPPPYLYLKRPQPEPQRPIPIGLRRTLWYKRRSPDFMANMDYANDFYYGAGRYAHDMMMWVGVDVVYKLVKSAYLPVHQLHARPEQLELVRPALPDCQRPRDGAPELVGGYHDEPPREDVLPDAVVIHE